MLIIQTSQVCSTHVAKSYSLQPPFSQAGLTKESASDSSIDSNEYSSGWRSPEAITGRDRFRLIEPDVNVDEEDVCGSEGFLNLSFSLNGVGSFEKLVQWIPDRKDLDLKGASFDLKQKSLSIESTVQAACKVLGDKGQFGRSQSQSASTKLYITRM